MRRRSLGGRLGKSVKLRGGARVLVEGVNGEELEGC